MTLSVVSAVVQPEDTPNGHQFTNGNVFLLPEENYTFWNNITRYSKLLK